MHQHVVVDGSNIATEGRPLPSLKQLNEAVLAYIEDHPDTLVTVVVDATFGHRIATKEIAEFDDAIANNELVSPPAGAIGRGDAFVLSIAKKAHATILSNDSFQEFHGEHPWLFDDGRLVGGKPVPHVGWVFVARNPVRGPISRRAVKDTKAPRSSGSGGDGGASGRPSALASAPMPVPTAPPPGRRSAEPRAAVDAGRAAETASVKDTAKLAEGGKTGRTGRGRRSAGAAPAAEPTTADASVVAQAPIPAKGTFINELMPFLSFVETHPVGSQVEITIDAYASHGAYATSGDARCYLPLRYMAEPAPRAARDIVKLGDTHVVVVVSFNPARRGIDVALPAAVPAGITVTPLVAADAPSATPASTRKPRAGRKAASAPDAPATVVAEAPAPVEPVAGEARPSRRRGSKAVAEPAAAPTAAPAAASVASEPSASRGGRSPRAGAAVSPPDASASRSRRPAAASDDEAATGRGRAGRRGKATAGAAEAAATAPTPEVFVPAPAVEAPAPVPMSAPDVPVAPTRRTRPAASTSARPAAAGRSKSTPAPVSDAPAIAPTKRAKAPAAARTAASAPAAATPVVAAPVDPKPAKKARAAKAATPAAAAAEASPSVTPPTPSARRRSPAKKAAAGQLDASGVKPLRAKKA